MSTESAPPAPKLSQEEIKVLVASGEICHYCRTRPTAVGAHGVYNGKVKSFHWCAKCYVKVHKQGSSKELDRLAQPED